MIYNIVQRNMLILSIPCINIILITLRCTWHSIEHFLLRRMVVLYNHVYMEQRDLLMSELGMTTNDYSFIVIKM